MLSGSESTIEWKDQIPEQSTEEIIEVIEKQELVQMRIQKEKEYMVLVGGFGKENMSTNEGRCVRPRMMHKTKDGA